MVGFYEGVGDGGGSECVGKLGITVIASGFTDAIEEKSDMPFIKRPYSIPKIAKFNPPIKPSSKKRTMTQKVHSSTSPRVESIPINFMFETDASSCHGPEPLSGEELLYIPAYKRQNIELDFSVTGKTNRLNLEE